MADRRVRQIYPNVRESYPEPGIGGDGTYRADVALHRANVSHVLSKIGLPLNAFFYVAQRGEVVYFRIEQWASDNLIPGSVEGRQRGRPWIVRPGADEGEIVRSAWLAFMTYAEHEFREQFTFRGERPMYPHFKL